MDIARTMTSNMTSLPGRLVSWSCRMINTFTSAIGGVWRKRFSSRRFMQLFAEDQKVVADASNQMEAEFGKTGIAFEKMSELTDTLVKEAEKVLEAALGKADSDSLRSPGINLFQWLNSLDETQRQLRPVLSRITLHQRSIKRVLHHEKRLRQSVSTLQILPSLFKIEAARLTPDSRQLFLALVKDINRVHQKVSDSLRTSFETVESMGRRLADGHTRFTRFVEIKCRAIGERKGQLDSSLIDNNQRLEANQKQNVSLLEATRDAHQQVGRIVIALQFQDITRQKLEHIDSMRREVTDTLERKRLNRKDLQFCFEAASLCQAHGDSVMMDVDSACQEIKEGVGQIESRLGRLDESCLTLRQFSTLAISADGFIQKMLDASEEVDTLTRDLVNGAREMYQFLEPLSGALSGLSVTMGQVSAEIRLIALNAQVQAIQNGLGTGLEILSARTCDVADDMYAVGEEMSAGLREITGMLQEDLERCRDLCESGEKLLETLETQGKDDANQLHAYRDRALDMLLIVSNIGKEIAERARMIIGSCSFDTIAKPSLKQAYLTLNDLKVELNAAIGPGRLPLKPGKSVDHFRQYYSVADERETHNRIFGEHGGTALPVSRSSTPATGSQPSPEPALVGPSATAFLFEDKPEPVTPASLSPSPTQSPKQEAAPVASDLGDNIELF